MPGQKDGKSSTIPERFPGQRREELPDSTTRLILREFTDRSPRTSLRHTPWDGLFFGMHLRLLVWPFARFWFDPMRSSWFGVANETKNDNLLNIPRERTWTMGETVLPLVEPDLVGVWRKNVWWFGFRWPFSMVLFSWVTVASTLAPEFHLDRYLLTMLAGFFGLVIGAHYIDITASKDKYLPYFPKMNRGAIRTVGVLAVLAGMALGVYMSLLYSLWFLVFVILGGFFALFYPIEKPKWLHTYPSFGIAWGFIPVLASYYIQATRIDLVGLGLAVFLGITVVEMHHMAVLTNEKEYSADLTKNARLLLKIHRTAAYSIGLILLISRLV